jgi:hypothetical protein
MLSNSERSVLVVFRQYLITPGQMLCFDGPEFRKHKPALRVLTEKGFLVKEKFDGGYSLTHAGFAAMKSCK